MHANVKGVESLDLLTAATDWVLADEVLDSIASLVLEYSLLKSYQLTVGITADCTERT